MIIEGFLVSIIIGMIVERYFYSRDMNRQVADCMKAMMARTPDEYITMKATERKVEPVEDDNEYVSVDALNDKQFDKFIKEETK